MNFEIPELRNFLKILQMEEDELLAQVIISDIICEGGFFSIVFSCT